jgi:hypothetical protein
VRQWLSFYAINIAQILPFYALPETEMPEAPFQDVVIVGGGVSGVYSGWRLLTGKVRDSKKVSKWMADGGGKLNVTLYEASHRIGGRLCSIIAPGVPDLYCEIGGMRYLTSQPLVTGLVQNKLRLGHHDLAADEPENIAYLRGEYLHTRDFTQTPAAVPYRLGLESGKGPGTVISDAIHRLVPGSENWTSAQWIDWQKHGKLFGVEAWRQGFWNVLAKVMSNETYKMALEAGGYNTTLMNWNAAAAFPWTVADFGPAVKYYALDQGYEHLPITLAEQFVDAGGSLKFGHRLKNFDVSGSGDDQVATYTVVDDATGDEITGKCRALILAMPRRSIELLDQSGVVLQDNHVQDLLATVIPTPLFKLFVAYPEPWWEVRGVTQGKSNTDLPIRQCYYWGTSKKTGHGVLLASYDDGRNTGFWQGLAEHCDKVGQLYPDTTAPGVQTGPSGERDWGGHWKDFPAPAPMVEEIHRQLLILHEMSDQAELVPKPTSAAYIN